MKNFIYDYYGYLCEEEDKFHYQGFTFNLEINQKNHLQTEEMNNFIINLSASLYGKRAYIVPSRNDQLLVDSEYGSVSLVSVENFDVTLNDIINFHSYSLKNNEKLNLYTVKELWMKKLNFIEQVIMPSLRIEEYYYQLLIICVTHAIGMATNAISYLQDLIIDYSKDIEIITLAHKRLKLNSYELLNPFNLIIDSPPHSFKVIVNFLFDPLMLLIM